MKKPTGRMGADVKDRINRCIAIDRRILDKTSSGILGASSEEDMLSPLTIDTNNSIFSQLGNIILAKG
jgi:hypothetical protein